MKNVFPETRKEKKKNPKRRRRWKKIGSKQTRNKISNKIVTSVI